MSSVAKDRSPLLPNRHPTPDFFVCDIFDAVPKADMASMEHPIFSLSTKPDKSVRRYEHGDAYVEIKPSSDGLATVHDRDVLIYCISHLMAAINDGREVSQTVRFRAFDLLKATNRMTNGQGYDALKAAFERLSGTRISTNIVTGGLEVFETFGLIERARIVRETRDGRMQ
ncbi:MAG: replication initiator protein A, partial [Phycisphaerae bacterium]